LVNLKKREWLNEPIEVIEGDMRAWRPKEEDLADILVSELLGSFGDNELSPECLDGGMHLIRPDDGISIPSSYTSYACPVMTSKLFQKVSQLKQGDSGGGDKREKNFSTPYVVYLQNCLPLSPPQPIFTFHHASSSPSSSPSSPHSSLNERFGQFEFHVEGPVGDLQCHGFVGYFKAVLYKHIVLSTVPEDHTPDMFSWFPIYFPIESELRVRSSSEKICLSIWRRVDSRQVWYEWCLENTESYATTRIHNSGGQSYWIGL
jgi:protein arginine N-methyltransferase 5